MNKQWTIGIDPGVGATGVVLCYDGEIVDYAVYHSPLHDVAWTRIHELTSEIRQKITDWLCGHPKIKELDFAIETPIYSSNPASFELQWRLIQELESSLQSMAIMWLQKAWITEVPPTTSKKLATGYGKATKTEIIQASPFSNMKEPYKIVEALADAWAHSLAAWQGCKDCLRFNLIKPPKAEVKRYA